MWVLGVKFSPSLFWLSYMGHHRNATIDDEADRFSHVPPAFKLHRARAGFGHKPGRVAKGLRRAFFVAGEGHVHDHQGAIQPTRHRAAMQDHHFHRDVQRRGHAVQDHPDAVAHQNQIAFPIGKLGHRGGISGQTDQRAAPLAGADIRYGEGFLWGGLAHSDPPTKQGTNIVPCDTAQVQRNLVIADGDDA